LFALWTSQLRI